MNNSLKEALRYGGTMALVHVASVYLDIRFKVPYSAFSCCICVKFQILFRISV